MTRADVDALLAQGNFGEALTLYRDSRTISERLPKADPGDMGRQRSIWLAFDRVGNALQAQGSFGEAQKSYQWTCPGFVEG